MYLCECASFRNSHASRARVGIHVRATPGGFPSCCTSLADGHLFHNLVHSCNLTLARYCRVTTLRYIGRTFIMPGQSFRRQNVRKKLSAVSCVLEGRSVLLVDDSIVRGTTSREIVRIVKEAGARKVFFCSASPPVSFPTTGSRLAWCLLEHTYELRSSLECLGGGGRWYTAADPIQSWLEMLFAS